MGGRGRGILRRWEVGGGVYREGVDTCAFLILNSAEFLSGPCATPSISCFMSVRGRERGETTDREGFKRERGREGGGEGGREGGREGGGGRQQTENDSRERGGQGEGEEGSSTC